jgi:4-hydroxybenzoate polyprenyltransferase
MASLYDRWRWLTHRIETSQFVTHQLPAARYYVELMRLHKPIGTYLLLWPALWALWLASVGRPSSHVFVIFILGVIVTRSAGCVINDYADRDLDSHVRRTKDRPLANGTVKPRAALILFVGLALLALALALSLNVLAIEVAVVGAALIISYPFCKRFFPLPQAYLGIAFSSSIPMAFAAQNGTISRLAWLIFIANVLWTIAYDNQYAMVDREDDVKMGVHSSAILFGDADRLFVGLLHATALLTMWLVGRYMNLSGWFTAGLCVAAVFALYQQYLIRNRDPEQCFRAFLNNNYFGMSVFAGISLHYIFN